MHKKNLIRTLTKIVLTKICWWKCFKFATSIGSKELPQLDKWLIDLVRQVIWLHSEDYSQEFESPEKVGLGDGRTVYAVGTGNAYINMQLSNGETKQCVIYKALYVPKLACNLFWVRAAAAKGKSMKFCNRKCFIYNRAGNVCSTGTLVGKLYQLDCEPVPSENLSVASEKNHEVDLWHQRLGHLGRQSL